MTTYLLTSPDPKAEASLEHARRALHAVGVEAVDLDVDDATLPLRDRKGRKLDSLVRHTPEPLLRSWRVARNLAWATRPGDVVVASDTAGLAGVFALMQASNPPGERRRIWTVAGDSAYLKLRLVAQTHEGLPQPAESEVDWEIVHYRFSERILATAPKAVAELARIGVGAELIEPPETFDAPPLEAAPSRWWIPGPVSRRSQTGEILRALTSVPDATATVTNRDTEDGIWTGTTWEALRHVREVLGGRVQRGDRPSTRPDVVVVGDPYDCPDRATRDLINQGIPVVVPVGSTCSLLWPDAPRWETADDLTAILTGESDGAVEPPTLSPTPPTPCRSPAERISVGIPIFRDVRFLDECVESVLSQELPPHEVILIDDGSNSAEVDDAVAAWEERDRRIRVIRTQHRGVCVARNTALEAMEGDSFVFVDADDILEAEFLAKTAEMLRGDDRLWAVASWTRFFGGYEGVEAKPPFDARVGRRENPIISTAALVDMAVRAEGIRFAPDLAFLYCEDWHFWSQIVAAGGWMGLVPEPLVRHRVHTSSGGFLRTELGQALGKTRATEPLRS